MFVGGHLPLSNLNIVHMSEIQCMSISKKISIPDANINRSALSGKRSRYLLSELYGIHKYTVIIRTKGGTLNDVTGISSLAIIFFFMFC